MLWPWVTLAYNSSGADLSFFCKQCLEKARQKSILRNSYATKTYQRKKYTIKSFGRMKYKKGKIIIFLKKYY